MIIINRLNLSGNDWKLIYVKNEKLIKDGLTNDITTLLNRGYTQVDATIPGNLEIDLVRAAKIDDPFFNDNFYDRSCEYLHAYYYKEFEYDGSLINPTLNFEGIDTISDIYLNNTFLVSTDNMLINHEINVSEKINIGKNTLLVHITPAVIKAREYETTLNDCAHIYNTESLYIRKAPHMYGWDIFPRIISCGIWKPVYLEERKHDRILDCFGYTYFIDLDKSIAKMDFVYNLDLLSDDIMRYTIKVEGICEDSSFKYENYVFHNGNHFKLIFDNAKFWWPKNIGKQNLYTVTTTLYKDGNAVDTHIQKLGIRMVDLVRTSTTDEDGNGEFRFDINGKKVFCLGTNWVPADALHSRDSQRIPEILPMLDDINCNTIRIWGGGVYESDELYDYCDEHGIMIWQDFIMGCAIYPQDDAFAKKIETEVTNVVKRLRKHPSIILWAGDNENDVASSWYGKYRDPNFNRLTRETIPAILRIHDYSRPYIPSSPYVDDEAYKTKLPTPEAHLWGPRDYFKGDFYKNAVAHFASETGYHGCASPKSIEKFVSKEYLFTATNSTDWAGIEDNKMWIAHATAMENKKDAPYFFRIRLMANQVNTLFGDSVPCNLCDFAKASQISQAEAKKYFIERFRISKWRRTGIIWWNLIDGWPQISDAVVDYYFTKKLAYNYIKRSQNPICFMYDEPDSNSFISLYVVNDTLEDKVAQFEVTNLTTNTIVASGTVVATADSSKLVCKTKITENEKDFYLIKWTIDGIEYSNHYMTNIKDIDYSKYMSYLEKSNYNEFEGF